MADSENESDFASAESDQEVSTHERRQPISCNLTNVERSPFLAELYVIKKYSIEEVVTVWVQVVLEAITKAVVAAGDYLGYN